jgi:hypothetical protein
VPAIQPYIIEPIWEHFAALLPERDLIGVISEKGKPSPLAATNRWVVERTNSWQNTHKKSA